MLDIRLCIAATLGVSLFTPLLASAEVFTKEQVCKAAIAATMGRNPKTIKVTKKSKEGIIHLSYKRPDDGKLWKVECKVEGQEVLWAMAGGRWRNHADDGKIYFDTATPSTLRVEQRFSDGSKTENVFTRKQLQ